MLQLSKIFYDRKILSLRTGGPIGQALSPVINPSNLKIEGWYATAIRERESYVLPAAEVRDIIAKGIVVNDHTSLTLTEDLVRLKNIIDLGFEVIGKTVRTESKKTLGKVVDYAVEDQSYVIKKLYITQGIIRNFTGQQLVVDRNQIIEITDRHVIVREIQERVFAGSQASQVA